MLSFAIPSLYRGIERMSSVARHLTARGGATRSILALAIPAIGEALWDIQIWIPPYMSGAPGTQVSMRSEEHTSELQSLMRISYAVFCLKKKNNIHTTQS